MKLINVYEMCVCSPRLTGYNPQIKDIRKVSKFKEIEFWSFQVSHTEFVTSVEYMKSGV